MHNGTPSKRWRGTDVKKIRKSIAEIKEEIYETLGGITGAVKYYKRHPSAFYPDYFKTPPQPQVVNNVNVGINAEADGEDARRKLETAFMGLIEARRASVGDPAVFVDGERINDGRVIEHQPSTADARPATAVNVEDSNSENPKSWEKGPLNARGGVASTPAETSPAGGKNKISNYPSPLSGGFAVALDGLDDHLSTTERFLLWKGHGGPP